MPKKKETILAIVLAVALVAVGGLYIRELGSHADTQALLEQKNSELVKLEADIAGKTSEIEVLNCDLEGKNSEIKALNSDLEEKNSEIKALNSDLEGKNSEIEALNSDLEGKNSEIEALNSDLEGKNSEIEALNSDLEGKSSEIEALNRNLQEAGSKFKEMMDDLKDKEATLDTLNARITGKDSIPDSVPGAYTATRKFLCEMDKEEIIYTYDGVDSYYDDCIVVPFELSQGGSIDVIVWVTPDSKRISYRVWDVIHFDSRDKAGVLEACNEMHEGYRFVQFSAWDDDTVNASYDLIIREGDDIGETAVEALLRVVNVTEEAILKLEAFAK